MENEKIEVAASSSSRIIIVTNSFAMTFKGCGASTVVRVITVG